MIRVMEECIGEWGVRGRISWIALGMSYHLLLRASELFTGDEGGVHQVYCLRRGDIAFFEKGMQLGPERRRAADTVEVHFIGGKRDQGRIGAVMVTTKGAKGVGEPGGNVVDLLVELFEYYGASIPGRENAPLKAYRSGAGGECGREVKRHTASGTGWRRWGRSGDRKEGGQRRN